MATTFENFYSYLVMYSIFSVKKIFFQELLALNEKEAIKELWEESEFSHARERCSHRCERLKNLVVH